MNDEIRSQSDYWNNEAQPFQTIYSHQKSSLANWLDRIFRKDMYDRFTFTIQHCDPIKDRKFLDVGCGNGLYSVELAKRDAAQVVGIDIAENMLKLCQDSAQREGVGNRCTFVHADLLHYNTQASFDVSFGIGLFDYIGDPLPVLKKMREVTKDKVIMSFPRFWTWRAPLRKIRLTIRGSVVYFYTKARVERLLQDAGFSDHQIYNIGKLHCVVGYCNSSADKKL